ncbi:MAG: biopolymer transport protein TolR [Hyphomicrobiaceae bacterium]|jgi:biopolymer transport protein TolR
MAGGSDSGDGGSISGINVTPLVDVMLVLLVIFMVTAPIMQEAVEIRLPRTGGGSPVAQETAVVVSVTRDGEVYLNDERVSVEAIGARVAILVESEPEHTVYVRGDEEGAYGKVVAVVAALKEAGVARLGLLTKPPTGTVE